MNKCFGSAAKRAVFAALASALSALFSAFGAGCVEGGSFSGLVSGGAYDETGYEIGNRVLKESFEEAEIHWTIGKVTVVCAKGGFSVEEKEGLTEDEQMRSKVENGKLTVRFWKPLYSAAKLSGDKELIVTVPENLKKISISSVSAKVVSQNLSATEIDIETVSGAVDIENVVATSADFSSVSGGISVKNLIAENADFDSTSGSLYAGGVQAKELSLGSVSGKITAELDALENLEAESVSGSVNVTLSGNGGVVEYSTTSGVFSTDLQYKNEGGKLVFGGGECKIFIETTSGSVKINGRG